MNSLAEYRLEAASEADDWAFHTNMIANSVRGIIATNNPNCFSRYVA